MPESIPDDNPRKVRFDMTINLGHVITVVTCVFLVIAQWGMMDKRVLVLEEFRIGQRERDAAQDIVSKEKFQEVRDGLTDLRRSVEKVADRLGAR
jgi:hypothetical protein